MSVLALLKIASSAHLAFFALSVLLSGLVVSEDAKADSTLTASVSIVFTGHTGSGVALCDAAGRNSGGIFFGKAELGVGSDSICAAPGDLLCRILTQETTPIG